MLPIWSVCRFKTDSSRTISFHLRCLFDLYFIELLLLCLDRLAWWTLKAQHLSVEVRDQSMPDDSRPANGNLRAFDIAFETEIPTRDWHIPLDGDTKLDRDSRAGDFIHCYHLFPWNITLLIICESERAALVVLLPGDLYPRLIAIQFDLYYSRFDNWPTRIEYIHLHLVPFERETGVPHAHVALLVLDLVGRATRPVARAATRVT